MFYVVFRDNREVSLYRQNFIWAENSPQVVKAISHIGNLFAQLKHYNSTGHTCRKRVWGLQAGYQTLYIQ